MNRYPQCVAKHAHGSLPCFPSIMQLFKFLRIDLYIVLIIYETGNTINYTFYIYKHDFLMYQLLV